jgi:peptidyl-prolyl cis-trans isomerase SurA
MSRICAALIMTCFIATSSSAQTLFTYGNHSADAKDFLRAFNKNNTNTSANKAKAMRDYLDLYIASRLKIREAYEKGYDSLPQIKSDIQTLRSQIIDGYLNDPKTVDRMVNEAFRRGQKDIHVAHIYISFRNQAGAIDSAEALAKANEVYDKLKKGGDFSTLAQEYSSDPSAKTNKGDIGYITVFTLPYQFENVVYNTPAGKFSSPYKSKIGYHIFKNLGERKALGKMKAAQILLAFPPDNAEALKIQMSKLADSLYDRLAKGDDFAKLANQFSNDVVSAASGGVIPDFTVGQYDPAFENVFMNLKNGELSKPFLTTHGFHILKRIGVTPVVTDPKNKVNMDQLREKVKENDRMQLAKTDFLDSLMTKISLKKNQFPERELWFYQDSSIDGRPSPVPLSINGQTVLFTLGKTPVTADNYVAYARLWRWRPDGLGLKPSQQIYNEFIYNQVENYYRDHLEDFNIDFRNQMDEFKEGNLFFEIMQREVWSKAQADSVALKNYYSSHKNKYNWKPSADAVIFFASDENTAKLFYDEIRKDPSAWKKTSEAFAERIVADSARYEFAQIPNANKSVPAAGLVTAPVTNKADGTVSFAYVLKTYPGNMPRNFNEAKGLVINDYQSELEKRWVSELKKKYPVKINESVWAKIAK